MDIIFGAVSQETRQIDINKAATGESTPCPSEQPFYKDNAYHALFLSRTALGEQDEEASDRKGSIEHRV